MSETVTLKCEGSSDDTFGVYGAGPDDDFDNCASGEPIVFKVSHGDDAFFVVGQYGARSGGWCIGVEPCDEPDERHIPDWPMRFERSDREYSPRLVITAPRGVKVKHVKAR